MSLRRQPVARASRLDQVLRLGLHLTDTAPTSVSHATTTSTSTTVTINGVEVSTSFANWSGLTLDEVLRLDLEPVNPSEYGKEGAKYTSVFTADFFFMLRKSKTYATKIDYYVVAIHKEDKGNVRDMGDGRILVNDLILSTDPQHWTGLTAAEISKLELKLVDVSEYGKDGAKYTSSFINTYHFFVKDLEKYGKDVVAYFVLARPYTDLERYTRV